MFVFAIGFTLGGLATCLFIALAPQHFMKMVSLMTDFWKDARWYEKIGLALLVVPIPGPVDEIIGFLVVRRILRRTRLCMIGS